MAIDPKTRAMVFHLCRIRGLSIRKVAKECNVSRAYVWRMRHIEMNVNKSSKNRAETRGRPKKLTARQQRVLLRSICILREQEGYFTIKRLMENAGISRREVSESTISRFLNKKGYYYLQARKKGLLTKADMKKRRVFSRKMREDFSTDVWTKEIAFYLDGTAFAYKRNPLDQARAPRARVWRKKSEGLDLGCTTKGRKTGTGGKTVKLMVAISFEKGVILCKAYDKLNGRYFAKFIDENFATMFLDADKGPKRLWIQDGDPSQNSALSRAAMARVKSTLIKIPPRSPDLNPIENVFKLVSDALREQAITEQIKKETFAEFKARVILTIKTLPITTINNIIASMPNRLEAIIKRKGQRLRY